MCDGIMTITPTLGGGNVSQCRGHDPIAFIPINADSKIRTDRCDVPRSPCVKRASSLVA